MARYLVDTTTLIDFSKRAEPQASRLLALLEDADHDVGVCAVVVAEFMAGVIADQREPWQRFLRTLTYWETPLAASSRAGRERYDYARLGQQITTADALIAATARAHDAVLITDNARHYPQPDLRTISLRNRIR
jgi:predicted nucleic acid-binding protein